MVHANGVHAIDVVAPSTIIDPGVAAGFEAAERTRHLQAALARLGEQVAHQVQRQATTERHLADLGKVLGQLGLEVDERLALVEQIVDKMTAPTEDQRFSR